MQVQQFQMLVGMATKSIQVGRAQQKNEGEKIPSPARSYFVREALKLADQINKAAWLIGWLIVHA